MKTLGMGGRLSLLVVVLLLSYYLGRPLYWEMQSRLQAGFIPFYGLSSVATIPDDQTFRSDVTDEFNITVTSTNWNSSSNATQDVVATQDVAEDTVAVQSEDTVGLLNSDVKQNQTVDDDDGFTKERRVLPPAEKSRPLHTDLRRAIWDAPSAGSEMPALEEFALRRELVDFRAKKNVIVVTFANYAFMGFVRTWIKGLTDEGVTNLIVGAMDTLLLEALYWEGIPTFDMRSNMKTNDVGWGSPTFHKMGREKVILVNALLSLDYEVLMCDTDIGWLKNPIPYIERYPDADILTSSDEVASTVDDESLEKWDRSNGVYNIGINHWRPTAIAKRFAAEWMKVLLSDDDIWDQNGFNDIMRRKTGPGVQNSSELFYSYNGTLKLGILPVSLFCSGHTYFVQALYKTLGLQPYAVHTTFQFAGTEGKRHRLREAKLFYDLPEYYDAPEGFLSYTPSLPEDLMRGGAHSVQTHFNLVNHQLLQVRNALAIASTLNRILIMPELWCRLDRLWFGHPGVLPGTRTKQPFLCPMDHIFEVNLWLKDLPEEDFGPQIGFREYSFLDNPRLSPKVRASTLKVILCKGGSPGCDVNSTKLPAIPGVVKFPMNSTEDQLKAALSSYDEAKVIEFSSMIGAFGGFPDEGRATRFSNRVKLYTGIWCCVMNADPGHIYYDIHWDKKPGWKPRPPATRADDHPPF